MPEYLHDLYVPHVPAYLREYASVKAMQRLQKVDMNCGMNYTSFPLFASCRPYTRYAHSIGTALLLSRFTDRREIILSGLYHDIAAPAFSHVIDFLNGDHENQESTEDPTRQIIAMDTGISCLLERDGITVDQIADYHMYPLADNDSPKLSADRLEYTLGNLVNYGFGSREDVSRYLEDLVCGRDEEGNPEMVFRDEKTAEAFALHALQTGHIYSCNEDRYGMEYLACILKKAVGNGILQYDDFMRTEPEVIALLSSSTMQEEWERFTKLCTLRCSNEPAEGYLQVHAKRRYIDPLCGNRRVSAYSDVFALKKQQFLQENQDIWMRGYTAKEIREND